MTESLETLVADSDRTTAAHELRQHHDSGRLTLDEFEGRLADVHNARTRGDLDHALRQLPRSEPPASLRVRDVRWGSLALQYALINVICILVGRSRELTATFGRSGSCSERSSCTSVVSVGGPDGASCRRAAS